MCRHRCRLPNYPYFFFVSSISRRLGAEPNVHNVTKKRTQPANKLSQCDTTPRKDQPLLNKIKEGDQSLLLFTSTV
jgi:hypothetical protein